MPLFLSGSNGVSGADGTAALPAVQGTDGDTGVFFPAANQVAIATGGVQRLLVDASGNVTTSVGSLYPLVLGTAVASTSGTAIDFTGIPSWVRRVTVMFNGVSTNGTSNLLVQIGAGSVVTTGYNSTATSGAAAANATSGFIVTQNITAATSQSGAATLFFVSGNLWVSSGTLAYSNASASNFFGGNSSALSGPLDRVRITTVGGTDTFDAGSINILFE